MKNINGFEYRRSPERGIFITENRVAISKLIKAFDALAKERKSVDTSAENATLRISQEIKFQALFCLWKGSKLPVNDFSKNNPIARENPGLTQEVILGIIDQFGIDL